MTKLLALAGVALVSGVIAVLPLFNDSPDDDFDQMRAAIFAVLAVVAFPTVLRQYLKERRRRSM